VQVWMDREFFEANIDSETCTPTWRCRHCAEFFW
jgi:hypothetical protein